MGKHKLINTDKAKNYYIKNDISYKDLSSMFNINVETLRKRAYKEKWQDLKSDYKASLITELKTTPDINTNDIDIDKLSQLRLLTVYKALTLLNNSFNGVLPTEINKIKNLTGALTDIDKVFTGIRSETDSQQELIDKAIFNLDCLFAKDGITKPLGRDLDYIPDFNSDYNTEFNNWKKSQKTHKETNKKKGVI